MCLTVFDALKTSLILVLHFLDLRAVDVEETVVDVPFREVMGSVI